MTLPATDTLSARPFFLRHIQALALRHIYLCIESWPRLIEIIYWPTINVLMQGFLSIYVAEKIGNAYSFAAIFVAGALFCEVLLRTSQGMMILFMEEIWSRNLGHLFASPLRFFHYSIGLMFLASIRMSIALIPASLMTYYLFNFSLFELEGSLLFYIPLLVINGWWMGLLIISMLLWLGLAAEWLTWMSLWLLIPFVAPYYPVSVLPEALQYLSYSLPATYVFESIKSNIATGDLRGGQLFIALGLNVLYLIGALWVYNRAHKRARQEGRLLQNGE